MSFFTQRISLAVVAVALASTRFAAADSFSTVVIDPGHGGFDRGGIAGQRVPEKVVALDTALRLQAILQRAGLRTVMTRKTDIFVPLPIRTAIANRERDAIFVSVHYNSSRRAAASGIETFFWDRPGGPLAGRIQENILTRVSSENRGVKRRPFYVLRECRLPAVLVECGFLTNPAEARLASNPKHRQRIAEQIAAAIIDQRSFAFPPPSKKKVRTRRAYRWTRQ